MDPIISSKTPRCLWTRSIFKMLLLATLIVAPGCSSLQSLGLPFTPGRYRLLKTTRQFAQEKTHRAELPRELSKGVLANYRVEPGDVIAIEPTDLESTVRLPGDQTVQPDGHVSLGKYGRLMVAGQTISEIQANVQATINSVEEKPGPISVRWISWESKVYYVMGEVNSPAAYPLKGNETVLDAIIAAGNLTGNANRNRIILTRPTGPDDCRVVLPICYRHIVQLGDTSTNYQIQPGDRIYVPSLGFFDDIAQTIFPRMGEVCPKCSSCQRNCPDGVERLELMGQGNSVPPTPLVAPPEKPEVKPQLPKPSEDPPKPGDSDTTFKVNRLFRNSRIAR